MKRSIKRIHSPIQDDIADLRTLRALPTSHLPHLDPFLFLNHHGHQIYPPHNRGLPFAPHPHRGFETVTFILDGDVAHRDSAGHESVINKGGVQWMTAGRGIVHEEISSKRFKEEGGDLEILQLWINLPARLKMISPRYIGKAEEEIPLIEENGMRLKIISGEWKGHKGAISPSFPLSLFWVEFSERREMSFSLPEDDEVFFYVARGSVQIDGVKVNFPHLVEFNRDASEVYFEAQPGTVLIFGHAQPHREPIVSYGPFVMNTREEIIRAIEDFESGKFN